MFIKCLKVGQLGTNCYVVCDKIANRAVIIDPGADAQRIVSALADTECQADYVLLTHGHYDHMGAAREVLDKTGAKLAVFEEELAFLNDPDANLNNMFVKTAYEPFSPDLLLRDGETLTVGALEFKFIHMPGHTPGSCSILCQDELFSGDTLFREDVGRTDLPGGSAQALRLSVRKMADLPGEYQVLPGHGEFTTMSHEREMNPYLSPEVPPQ